MNRRTLLTRIVGTFAAISAVGFSVPFLRSLVPTFNRDVTLDVDISGLVPGEAKQVRWLGRNVLVIRRNQQSLASLEKPDLQDADSIAPQQPGFARNSQRSRKPEHLLVYANCTHLGCEVAVRAEPDFDGFDCPCHFSRFDAAGRVEEGAAAKLNLEVPYYDYVSEDVIRLTKIDDSA